MPVRTIVGSSWLSILAAELHIWTLHTRWHDFNGFADLLAFGARQVPVFDALVRHPEHQNKIWYWTRSNTYVGVSPHPSTNPVRRLTPMANSKFE